VHCFFAFNKGQVASLFHMVSYVSGRMTAIIYIPVLLGMSGLSISTYCSKLPRMLGPLSHWL